MKLNWSMVGSSPRRGRCKVCNRISETALWGIQLGCAASEPNQADHSSGVKGGVPCRERGLLVSLRSLHTKRKEVYRCNHFIM